jgi:hypothetical protein
MTAPAKLYALGCLLCVACPELVTLERFFVLSLFGVGCALHIVWLGASIGFRTPLDIVNDEMRRQRERRQR